MRFDRTVRPVTGTAVGSVVAGSRRAREQPAPRAACRPARRPDFDRRPLPVGGAPEAADRVTADEVAKGGAAGGIAQVDLAGRDDRLPRRVMHVAKCAPVAVPATRPRASAIEVSVCRPAGQPFKREIGFEISQLHPPRFTHCWRQAVAPDEAVHRAAQRRCVQTPRVARGLASQMLPDSQCHWLVVIAEHRRRQCARPHPQERGAHGLPRLVADIDLVGAEDPAGKAHRIPARSTRRPSKHSPAISIPAAPPSRRPTRYYWRLSNSQAWRGAAGCGEARKDFVENSKLSYQKPANTRQLAGARGPADLARRARPREESGVPYPFCWRGGPAQDRARP